MQKLAFAAAIAAVMLMIPGSKVSNTASAQGASCPWTYGEPGKKWCGMCWRATDASRPFGFWTTCPKKK